MKVQILAIEDHIFRGETCENAAATNGVQVTVPQPAVSGGIANKV
ncbi:hypothetical protein MACH17_27000 [Phaeobacter inhibens]|nr:hypothetical protein MACH17_27000 [Phaeobacter inhibens]